MSNTIISFSYNWNNKLQCKAFTTVRLYNPRKYKEGGIYQIYLKKELVFEAEIIAIKQFVLSTLNEFISNLDTGYSVVEMKEILLKMYPFVKNKPNTMFSIILLKKLKK